MYKIKATKKFFKDFNKIDLLTQNKVLVVLEAMREKPLFNSKKLKNVSSGIFRQRIGNFRLRFDLSKKERKIFLYCIQNRKDVYRK
jgi:mRNA-degrading endonuclease RelE of RelBE toxin-antitoxin system